MLIRSPKLKSLSGLLVTPSADTAYQADRLRFMERNIGLTVKAVVGGILYYYLFLSTWFEGLSKVGDVTFETVYQLFLAYLIINIIVAVILVLMDRLPLRIVQSAVFTSNFLDGLFLAAVTLITGGLESIAYWVFLALIIRNAFSFPVASLQLGLNVLMICCYLLASVVDKTIDKAITDLNRTTIALDEEFPSTRPRQSRNLSHRSRAETTAPLPPAAKRKGKTASIEDNPARWPFEGNEADREESKHDTQYLLMRIFLLLLMTACGYGVQVLFDKQQRADEEAREFALRQEQLRSAGRLAAEIAHQIKNPLGIINNAAFTLQRTVKEGKSTITQQIRIIREEVERSDRIITELIGYAQLAEGRVEKLNVVEVLDSAIEQVFPPAAKFQIDVKRDYGSALPPILIQRGHLSEIFVNLLQNAREALQGQGTIEVGAHYVENYSVMVSVSDDGAGIPPEIQQKIFEPYFTTKEKGTGLGLAIVKHNVETYGGSVKVESELGKGTRFTLIFPGRTLMKLQK
jgi:signal transduction histidine kinase